MKIACSKRDDVLRRKQEYESERAGRQSRYDSQYGNWRNAVDGVYDSVSTEVRNAIGETFLNLEITTNQRYGSGLSVSVSDEDDKFNEDKAIAWSWKVMLSSSGEVIRDSSSWSGLKATTQKHLKYLKEVLRVLTILNGMDWKNVLNRDVPEYDNYVTEKNPRYDNDVPDFDRLLMEADIEDVVGTDTLVKGKATQATGYTGNGYYLLLKETPSQYVAIFIPDYYLSNMLSTNTLDSVITSVKNNWKSCRILKSKITEIFGRELQFYQEGED